MQYKAPLNKYSKNQQKSQGKKAPADGTATHQQFGNGQGAQFL